MSGSDSGTGCFSFLIFLFGAVFLGFFAFLGMNQTVVRPDAPPPPQAVPTLAALPTKVSAGPALEVILAPADPNTATQDAMIATVDMLEGRLLVLRRAAQINSYSVLLNEDLSVQLELGGLDSVDAIAPALLEDALFEVVAVTPEVVAGDIIATTGNATVDGPSYETILSAADILVVSPSPDQFGGYAIEIALLGEAGERFGLYTDANIGGSLALVLNNEVLSVPTIQSRITSPILLTGNFTESEAATLAAQISSDPLPVPLVIDSVRVLPQ